MVARVFEALVWEQERNRQPQRESCYEVSNIDAVGMDAKDAIRQQLALLEKARAGGRLDTETVQVIEARLARELEMLSRVDALRKRAHTKPDGYAGMEKDIEALVMRDGRELIVPSSESANAARMILWLESVEPAQPGPK